MAQAIPFDVPPRDPRKELQVRLEAAPVEHAEAVLAAYEVLQGLHDRGALEFMRGALGASDKIIEDVVDAAKTPEAVRGIRNLIILAKTLGNMDPEAFRGFAQALPEALAESKSRGQEPPGFWGLWWQFRSKELRRGVFFVNNLLRALGRNLPG